jgi:hypothetical protein
MPARPCWLWRIVHTLLVATSIITGMLLKHDATVVNPYSPAEEARRFFADNPLSIFQAYGLDGARLLVCAVVVPSG